MSTETNRTILNTIYNQHKASIAYGLASVDPDAFYNAATRIVQAILTRKQIFTVGNGASAAIAQHWACDYTKGCSDLYIKPKVISLAANIPLMTAISNDIDYKEVYSYQLQRLAEEGDMLISISSSGNSPNIVKAIEVAKEMGIETIALTGMHGGKCKELADISLHVDLHEYEATEDVHQALMHTIAKYIRTVTW